MGTLKSERGSMLILVVVAMLVMGVLSISFALLADMEVRIGVSYKQQAVAEALAEAALEHARDIVRTAPTEPLAFGKWFQAPFSHILFPTQTLNGGTYSARLDNDCAMANTVPTPVGGTPGIEEPPHAPGATPCNNTDDYNETAVITAWAQSGSGRSRIRAIVAVDNPWKHVCSNAKPDNNGYCNEAGNRNGNPTVTPSDPNDPNGPAAYGDLPRPILGCSRIAPGLHRNNADTLAVHAALCAGAHHNMKTYPYPTGAGVPRFVMMGDDPAAPLIVGLTPRSCGAPNDDPASAVKYFGYFDCALTTFCDPNAPYNHACNGGGIRKACVVATDSRVLPGPSQDLAHYVAYNPLTGECGGGGADEQGMVYRGENNIPSGGGSSTVTFNGGNIGSPSRQVTVYVLNGDADFGNNKQFYGTFVVEGNENTNPSDKDATIGNGANPALWAGPNSSPPGVGWTFTNQYGFPIALLMHNPDLAPPTVSPYAPQAIYADLGSSNTEIHGMVFSSGHVAFNPLSFDGTVVAYEIQTQGSASYTYNSWYGNNVPPPGFPIGGGSQVSIIRKSFVVCVNYSDDSAGATGCN
jgi:hypothetical protein